jgi:adenylate cyclase
MSETRTTRRLAAILAADVVGYSRLMAGDEAGTLAALKRHRQALFDPTVTLHSGRVFKLIGDGTLVEFASVVDAVNCALAIQRSVAAAAEPGPRIILRIGVNLGDIIVEGDDIYGDGVNVAARLEPLAEPGGVCVASIVAESVGSRIDVRFADGGEVHVKNIDRPIRVWKWHPGTAAPATGTQATAATPQPAAPTAQPPRSVAVLPFANMSGDAEQEYFSDGISEDLITDLSKVSGLTVIARNSSFAYKGKNVDIRAVGRDLGVKAVLEGSIRRAGNRVRITAQLIDAATGGHLWAERYDRDLTDIFEVQDEVTRQIIAALKLTLTPQEQSRIAAAGTNSVEAHDLVLQAREIMTRSNKTRAGFERLLVLLDRALALDPNYSDAYACLGWAHQNDFQNRWSDDPDNAGARALAYAERAIAADPGEPLAHYVASIVTMFGKDLDRSLAEAEKALAVSPNYALALNARGAARVYLGDFQKGIPDIERAMRLDPGFSQQYLHFLGVAHFMLGQYETAAAHFRERVLLVPETDFSRAFLAATLGHLGHSEEARDVWQDLKRVNPRYLLAQHMERQPFRNPADVARIVEGLAKAGLPD